MQTPPDRQVVPVILVDAVLVAWLPAQHVAWMGCKTKWSQATKHGHHVMQCKLHAAELYVMWQQVSAITAHVAKFLTDHSMVL